VRSFLDHCDEDILVIDGLGSQFESVFETASVWKRSSEDRLLILVTSSQIPIKKQELLAFSVTRVTVPPWTLEEYRYALHTPSLFNSVKHVLDEGESFEDRIQNKYFLAGGSVRWMFHFSSQEVASEINGHIQRITDLEHLVSGVLGAKNNEDCNHLLMRDWDQTFLVSEYAMRLLHRKFNPSVFL